MTNLKQLFFALCLFCAMPTLAQAQLKNDESRGELLYAAHCSACHTVEIHWRKQKLATDWNSLVAQVRRWQASSGLFWSYEEIDDVARYLNARHYGFPTPLLKGYSRDNKPDQVLRR
jgi:mono/diheme cytochrome c family protein